jgi:hypothetical protein
MDDVRTHKAMLRVGESLDGEQNKGKVRRIKGNIQYFTCGEIYFVHLTGQMSNVENANQKDNKQTLIVVW